VGQEDQGEEYQSLGFLIWIMLTEVSREISIEITGFDIKISMEIITEITGFNLKINREIIIEVNSMFFTLIFGVHQAYPSCVGALSPWQ
jgi:hypothetical protein